MKTEIRVTGIEELNKVIDLDFDYIGIGDEFCHYRFPNCQELIEMIKFCEDNEKKWILVTPFMSNKAILNFENIISKVYNEYDYLEIVVNDYGFLMKLNEIFKDKNYNIIMGQMLVHSLEEYPWVAKEMKGETDEVMEKWLYNGYVNEYPIKYFQKFFNLKGIVINHLPNSLKSADFVRKLGVEVAFMDKYYPITVARKCHIARLNNIKPSFKCKNLCNDIYKIHIKKTYSIGNPNDKYIEVSKDIEEKIKEWYVFGNVVYKEYENEFIKKVKENDKIVIQYRFYKDKDKLKDKLKKYKEGSMKTI